MESRNFHPHYICKVVVIKVLQTRHISTDKINIYSETKFFLVCISDSEGSCEILVCNIYSRIRWNKQLTTKKMGTNLPLLKEYRGSCSHCSLTYDTL